MFKNFYFFFVLALVVTACSNPNSVGRNLVTPNGGDLSFTPVSFVAENDCTTLLNNIHHVMGGNVGAYGFDNDFYKFGRDDVMILEAQESLASDDAGESVFFTETTVQETNIDEPDTVKVDEGYMYFVSGDILRVFAHQDNYVEIDSYEFDQNGSFNLSLYENKIVVFGDVWDNVSGFPASYVSVLDFDGENIILEKEAVFEDGSILAARLTDGIVRVAFSHVTPEFDFAFPETAEDEGRAIEFNRSVVSETTIEDWLPEVPDLFSNDSNTIPCENIYLPDTAESPSLTSLMSFDLGANSFYVSAVFGSVDTAYMSANNFYVADSFFERFEEVEDGLLRESDQFWKTDIYRFSLEGSTSVPEASGQIEGRLLNQFSLSEYDGALRVVTTEESERDSVASLNVLDATSQEVLSELGFVTDMGRGEQVFAVNMIGDVGYVVTFRQTDPLYVLDLSDASNPTVEGELKITGFSDRIYPVNEDYIIGLGQEGTEEGEITGFKAALFDVSDPSNPLTADVWVLDDASSLAQWDHRAYTWDSRSNTAIFPVEQWGYRGQEFVGLQGLEVDLESGELKEGFSFDASAQEGPAGCVNQTDAEADFFGEGGLGFYECESIEQVDLPDNCWFENFDDFNDTSLVVCEEFAEGYMRSAVINDEVVAFTFDDFDVFEINS